MMENNGLVVKNLIKTYPNGVRAVNDISFEVKKGSLFAFLGVNGAGKSTTINIICSILSKDSGQIYVDGLDLDKKKSDIKNLIGVVFQNSVLDKDLTVYDNLKYRTAFYSMKKDEAKEAINKIIDILDLKPILKMPIKNLSGGQKRRVDIARAIVHSPKFLILDEPTTGLDPKNRQIVWKIIDKIRVETKMTVFLTTHYLEEADAATDVVIMDKGVIIARGTPNELKNEYSYDYIIGYLNQNEEFEHLMDNDNVKYSYDLEHSFYKIIIDNIGDAKDIINKYSEYLTDIEIKKGTMDDVFLNVTGKDLKNE